MQITVNRNELKAAAQGLGKITNGRSSLPVLGAMRFAADKGSVTATATDLDSTASYAFSDASSDADGVIVIGMEHVKPLVKARCEGHVVFELEGVDRCGAKLTAAGQPISKSLPAIDPAEWPSVGIPDIKTVVVPGFLDTYRMLTPFASRDETRHVINSVYLDVSDSGPDGAVMLATDGRRLAARNHMSLPLDSSCVVRVSKFLTWTRLPADAAIGTATTGKKDDKTQWFQVETGPWRFASTAIAGTYPNWRQVVPCDPGVNRVELSDEAVNMLIEALPSLPGGEHMTIVGRDGALSVWGRDADAPEWTVLAVPGAGFTGSEVAATSLDRNYVLDALKAGLMRTLVFSDEMSPVLSQSGDGGTHVLMPMRDGLPDEIREAIVGLREAEAQKPEEEEPEAKEPEAPKSAAEEPEAKEPETSDDNVTPTPSGITPDSKSKEDTVPETKQERRKPETETNPMERVLLACDTARAKLGEARQEIVAISTALREAIRDQKQQTREMDQARQALAKLQGISL